MLATQEWSQRTSFQSDRVTWSCGKQKPARKEHHLFHYGSQNGSLLQLPLLQELGKKAAIWESNFTGKVEYTRNQGSNLIEGR